ncbi:type I methionyl aminopeptidase [Blochmannia endosymbiont of Polyrhachis (Hedomyrma) turneri]|uniref:type I methionyl aminopeptidase n=1 Tax=Blochmannia endosymbiont of Polyrhachis (Hedomyrma) turneri TaxID=1505596 RepID=UPI00061A6FA5|nr:type I methionyl aminopeptidase [Blochmannia endosymbiont of Polyrhachis (Hedomyrma) turneri]AKC59866.1 methionine aminopeptidase [Blochmannia endosymbiont of Polyrhachis (Hedomyrma) turneri]
MPIFIKTSSDIRKMRLVGKCVANVLAMIECYVQPGISTAELDRICSDYIINKQSAVSATLGYRGFPGSICTSVNEVVCHGIPSSKTILNEGDIVNIDVAIIKYGFYADTSKMFFVGTVSPLAQRLCKVTQDSLYLAISMVKPGMRLRLLGKAIQEFVEKQEFSIVKEYCGHGIGRNFHEEPHVFHHDTDDNGVRLTPGMVLTIEPMVNIGNSHTYTLSDGWTVKTKDHSLSAQYEHTIVITNTGCEIITARSE